MLEELNRYSSFVVEQEEIVIKELLERTGYNVDHINAENVEEVKKDLSQQGYKLTFDFDHGASIYRLYLHDKLVAGVAMKPDVRNEGGKLQMAVKKEFMQ